MMGIPRPLLFIGAFFALLLLIPPFVIARIRASQSTERPVHLIWDMDIQAKFKPQSANPLFADGRAMRPVVAGTVAVGETGLDTHRSDGVINGQWATSLPAGIAASKDLLVRGQARFNIYCSPCHGFAGFGDGIVNQRAMALLNNTAGPPDGTAWVQAKSLHDDAVRPQPIGQIYHTIGAGIRNMAGYASQIPVEDRWAIAAYVKALQLSQNASIQDVPPDQRAGLEKR